MPSIISDVERQLRARMEELAPLIEEYEQLRQVLATFEQARATPAAGQPAPARRRSPAKPATSGRRGRPRGSATGGRANEALRLVGERPGITVAELAEEMGIGPTYLYRVLPSLEREGKVRKQGTGYKLAGSKAGAKAKTT